MRRGAAGCEPNLRTGGGQKRQGLSADAPDNAGFVEIVGGHFHFHAISGGEADKTLPHFTGDGRQDHMLIIKPNAEHCPREDCFYTTFNFNMIFHAFLIAST